MQRNGSLSVACPDDRPYRNPQVFVTLPRSTVKNVPFYLLPVNRVSRLQSGSRRVSETQTPYDVFSRVCTVGLRAC